MGDSFSLREYLFGKQHTLPTETPTIPPTLSAAEAAADYEPYEAASVTVLIIIIVTILVVGLVVFLFLRIRKRQREDAHKRAMVQMSSTRHAGVYLDLTSSGPGIDDPDTKKRPKDLEAQPLGKAELDD